VRANGNGVMPLRMHGREPGARPKLHRIATRFPLVFNMGLRLDSTSAQFLRFRRHRRPSQLRLVK